MSGTYLHRLVVIGVLLCFTFISIAQVPLSNAEILASIESKGISESQLNEFLDIKGLSISDLQSLSPEEFLILDQELDNYIENQKPAEVIKQEEAKVVESIPPPIIKEPETLPSIEVTEIPIGKKRYGDQLFQNNSISLFEEGRTVNIPGTYILNTGDEVRVSIYGISKLEEVYPIQEDGSIVYNNGNRRIFVAGLNLNQVRTKIEKVFRQFYVFKSGEIDIELSGTRIINLNVYGEVVNPGGYVISAVNSPINALLAAKGIRENGSYRNITLLKGDGSSLNIDLYKYLEDPSSLLNVSLSNGDVLHVPMAKKNIELTGAVKRPDHYELKNNEKLVDLLNFSGGFLANSDKKTLQVIRFVNSERKVIDIDLGSNEFRAFGLQDGDIVSVKSIESELQNSISAEGELNNPGIFELKENMKISDLVSQLVLNENSRTDVVLLNRYDFGGASSMIKVNLDEVERDPNSDANIALQANDKLLIWSNKRFVDPRGVIRVNGAVRSPGSFPFANTGINLSDAILFSGGLRRDASNVGMIYRKDPLNSNNIQYIRINPELASQNQGGDSDISLMAYDSIVILEAKNIQELFTVSIDGQVRSPGTFQFGEGMTLQDLVILANGFDLAAQTDQIEINRTIIQNNKPTEIKVATLNMNRDLGMFDDESSNYLLKPFDKVFVRTVPQFELPKIVVLEGEVKYPGTYVIEKRNERLMELVERAGGLTKEAFLNGASLNREQNNVGLVIMNISEAQKSAKSKYNYILKSGDKITIPKQEDIVTIKSASLSERIRINGDVTNSLSIGYYPGKNAKFYINEFGGGFGDNSDRANLYVEHANGEISRTKNFILFNHYPKVRKGSVIVIPEKAIVLENADDEEKVDWTQLLNDSVAQAMSILTLLLLVERL